MVAIETSIWARVEMGELDTQKHRRCGLSRKCSEVIEISNDVQCTFHFRQAMLLCYRPQNIQCGKEILIHVPRSIAFSQPGVWIKPTTFRSLASFVFTVVWAC